MSLQIEVAKLNRFRCAKCANILSPPIYHCNSNHYCCGICYDSPSKCIKCIEPPVPCLQADAFFSQMKLPCPNEPGCPELLSIYEYSGHTCRILECPCGFLYSQRDELTRHLGVGTTHDAFILPFNKTVDLKVVNDCALYFVVAEGTIPRFLLVKVALGEIYVQNMLYDSPMKIRVIHEKTTYNGVTSSLPVLLFPKTGISFSLTLLETEANVKPVFATVYPLEDLGCLTCLSRPLVPPVSHCSARHFVCECCLVGVEEKAKSKNHNLSRTICLYCGKQVVYCRLVSELFRASRGRCPSSRCENHIFQITTFGNHLDQCCRSYSLCPICNQSYPLLSVHFLSKHPIKQILEGKSCHVSVASPGYTILQDAISQNTFYTLGILGQNVFLQHFDLEKTYAVRYGFYDASGRFCRWIFGGKTEVFTAAMMSSLRSLEVPVPIKFPCTIVIKILRFDSDDQDVDN